LNHLPRVQLGDSRRYFTCGVEAIVSLHGLLTQSVRLNRFIEEI
jgi:hypothetical protein